MKTYIKLEPPYEWIRLDGRRVLAFGELPSLASYQLDEEEELIAVVPGEFITSHMVELPAKSRKQFLAALPYALEEQIVEDVESVEFICPHWLAGAKNLVYTVSAEKMRQWQLLATEHQLAIDELVTEYDLLPQHDAAKYTLAKLDNGNYLAKDKEGIGVSLDQAFLTVWLKSIETDATVAVNDAELTEMLLKEYPGRDFRHWSIGSKLAHWLEHSAGQQQDLMIEKYRPAVRKISLHIFKWPALLIACAVICLMIFDAYRYFGLHHENRQIDQKMANILTTQFPEIDNVSPGKERFMMQQAINRGGGANSQTGFQGILGAVAKVAKSQRVTIMDMTYRDRVLVITCLLNDFSQVDKLTKLLNADNRISASLQSSSSNGGQINARYSIKQG